MNTEIVHATHFTVHHEFHRKSRRLTRFEDHRTDGRNRGSASLLDFDIRHFGEAQVLIADVGELERHLDSSAQLDFAQVHFLLIHS